MMLCEPIYELSQMLVAERLQRAERERFARHVRPPHSYLSGCAAWSGRVLVRLGRRLEVLGGGAYGAPAVEMRRRTLSQA